MRCSSILRRSFHSLEAKENSKHGQIRVDVKPTQISHQHATSAKIARTSLTIVHCGVSATDANISAAQTYLRNSRTIASQLHSIG
jgi:hypothetical protein